MLINVNQPNFIHPTRRGGMRELFIQVTGALVQNSETLAEKNNREKVNKPGKTWSTYKNSTFAVVFL